MIGKGMFILCVCLLLQDLVQRCLHSVNKQSRKWDRRCRWCRRGSCGGRRSETTGKTCSRSMSSPSYASWWALQKWHRERVEERRIPRTRSATQQVVWNAQPSGATSALAAAIQTPPNRRKQSQVNGDEERRSCAHAALAATAQSLCGGQTRQWHNRYLSLIPCQEPSSKEPRNPCMGCKQGWRLRHWDPRRLPFAGQDLGPVGLRPARHQR
jgi:hypothetical protein